jgi:hypothetical protein
MKIYRRLLISVLSILLIASIFGSTNLLTNAQAAAATITTAARKKPKAVTQLKSYKLAAARATGTMPASGYLVLSPGQKPYYFSPNYAGTNLDFGSGQQAVADTTVNITGGGGSGATAQALVSGVTGLTLQSGGAGYISAPTVTFLGGGGTGASAVATISNGVVVSLTLTSGGSGYLIPPAVVLIGGGVPAPPAVATASIAPGAITGITVTNPGSGYTSNPAITIQGSGQAAIAIPVVKGGQLTGITVTNPGFGYGLSSYAITSTSVPVATSTPTP